MIARGANVPLYRARPGTLSARAPGACGFTLVELLVSIAIIALLIGILVPSLRSARNSARRVACMANLKGIAAASLVYAGSDPHEQMIPVHGLYGSVGHDFGAYDYGGKSAIGEPQSGNDPASSAWGTQNGRGPTTRPLNNALFKDGFTDYQNSPGANGVNWLNDTRLDLDLFHCPSDRGYDGLHFGAWKNSGLTSYDHYGTSYASALLWDAPAPDGGPSPDCKLYSFSVFLHSSSRVLNPANTLCYVENGTRFGWLFNVAGDAMPSNGPTAENCFGVFTVPFPVGGRAQVCGWHGHPFIASASFADGHADWIDIKGHQRPAPQLPHYPNMWEDIGAIGYYGGIQCAIVRGSGWQLDVLPAPDVRSAVSCEGADTVFIGQ